MLKFSKLPKSCATQSLGKSTDTGTYPDSRGIENRHGFLRRRYIHYNTRRPSEVECEPVNKVTIQQDGNLGKRWDSHYNLRTMVSSSFISVSDVNFWIQEYQMCFLHSTGNQNLCPPSGFITHIAPGFNSLKCCRSSSEEYCKTW